MNLDSLTLSFDVAHPERAWELVSPFQSSLLGCLLNTINPPRTDVHIAFTTMLYVRPAALASAANQLALQSITIGQDLRIFCQAGTNRAVLAVSVEDERGRRGWGLVGQDILIAQPHLLQKGLEPAWIKTLCDQMTACIRTQHAAHESPATTCLEQFVPMGRHHRSLHDTPALRPRQTGLIARMASLRALLPKSNHSEIFAISINGIYPGPDGWKPPSLDKGEISDGAELKWFSAFSSAFEDTWHLVLAPCYKTGLLVSYSRNARNPGEQTAKSILYMMMQNDMPVSHHHQMVCAAALRPRTRALIASLG